MTDNSVTQIRTALANSMSGITGLRTAAVWPGVVNPPIAVVRRSRTDYGTEFNGGDTSTFLVSLYLSSVDTVSSQYALDDYLSRAGAQSVIAAIQADTTLGGVVRNLAVDSVSEEGLTELAGNTYLSATIPVLVVHE